MIFLAGIWEVCTAVAVFSFHGFLVKVCFIDVQSNQRILRPSVFPCGVGRQCVKLG